MVEIVGAVDAVVGPDVQAVRPDENSLAPGELELSVGGQHHHRMFGPGEQVDLVARIRGHAGHFAELPAGGQPRPVELRYVSEPGGADRRDFGRSKVRSIAGWRRLDAHSAWP